MSDAAKLTRREMIQTTAAALTVPVLAGAAGACAPGAKQGGFLTASELAMLDELTDIIIPTDEKSPGAKAAGVAAYIDQRLAESLQPEWQERWRSGLKAVNDLSHELHGGGFMDATPEQRVAVVTKMAAGESDPKTPAEKFFGELKRWTVRSYYTSKIGIQVDQEYKGNVYQPGEYAGYDVNAKLPDLSG